MGPRLFSHGYVDEETVQKKWGDVVSMGPRLFSHGYGGRFSAFTAIEKMAFCERFVNFLENIQEVYPL